MVKQAIVMVAVLELQDGDLATALYVIFSALARIVRAVLLVKGRLWRILAMNLLFFLSRFVMSSFSTVQISRVRKIMKSDYLLRRVCFSVFPSVLMEQLVSHLTDFHDSLHYSIF
jgi:uncharacterized membrane protein